MFQTLDPSDQMATVLLQGLKRDAFVMEYSAYQQPEIPSDDEFASLYSVRYEQLHRLLGWPSLRLACITQLRKLDGSYQSIYCIQWERSTPPFVQRTPRSDDNLIDDLGSPFQTLQNRGIIDAIVTRSNSDAEREDLRKALAPPDLCAVAPYYVSAVLNKVDTEYEDLARVLRLEGAAMRNGFLLTEPFVAHGSQPTTRLPREAYFASVLGLGIPDGIEPNPAWLRWLELIQISFQLSFGFPTLARNKARAAKEKIAFNQLQRQNEQLEAIRRAAVALAGVIDNQVNEKKFELLQLTHVDHELDRHEMAFQFDAVVAPDKPAVLLACSDGPIEQLHKPHVDDQINQAFVAFVIHSILAVPANHCRTRADVVASAAQVLREPGPSYHPVLIRLLSACLERHRIGFEILKQLCFSPQRESRALAFFSVAIRLLVSRSIPKDFKVTLVNEFGSTVTLTADNAHDVGFQASLPSSEEWGHNPQLPSADDRRHIRWLAPFVDFVTRAMQRGSPTDQVHVPEVILAMPRLGEEDALLSISCTLNGDTPDSLDRLQTALDEPPREGERQRDTRIAWNRLRTAAKEFDAFALDKLPDRIVLRIKPRT